MLAWRSLLNRPQLLLSRVRRHASHRTAVLAGQNSLIRSRGYAIGDSHAEDNRQKPVAKRHLYVVLDDSKDGFGIHKLNLDDDKDLDGGPARFPEPPLLRVAFPTVNDHTQFAAVGSRIVALGSCGNMHGSGKHHAGGLLLYDTKTAAQVVSPQLPRGLIYGYQAAMAAGGRLYMLESVGSEYYYKYDDENLVNSGLHCLTADRSGDDDKFWRWQPLSPPPHFLSKNELSLPSSSWYWSNNDSLLMLPFYAEDITAHAVHTTPGAAPHEHQIFVSVSSTPMSEECATFSFRPPTHEWTHPVSWVRHGDWKLPVVGHAHYDGKLDAWLGLHLADGYTRWPNGYLCAGKVTSAPSEWKVGKEKLCRLDEDIAAGWIYVDAKLVPMASTDVEDGTEYCLMERMQPKEGACLGDGEKCLLRLTTFHVTSGQNGEPGQG